MMQTLRVFSYGHGGLGVALLAVGLSYLPARVTRSSEHSIALVRVLWAVACLSMAMEFVLTTWYLFSPAYLDHIEASVASNVHYFQAGRPLYPLLDTYSLNGLLYGPLLTEVNSLGYIGFHGSFSAKVVGWLAGWTAVGVLIAQSQQYVKAIGSSAALTYAFVFLFSFGPDLTLDRSEPLLLLLTASSLIVALKFTGLKRSCLLGALCGAAANLKLHAPLYLVPALYLWISAFAGQQWQRHGWMAIAGFATTATATLVLPFLPQNVTLAGYVHYLGLGARHGLSLDLFGRNAAFIVGLWAPILLLVRALPERRQFSPPWRGFAVALLSAECLVLIVASKPGAGIHHFLPFVAPHAYLFQQLARLEPARRAVAAALAIATLGVVTPTIQTFGHLLAFDLRLPEHKRQRDELLVMADRYPRGMLGVSDNSSYELANFRPWLTERGISQTDYGAFMDLELSGASEQALRSAFMNCEIPFLYIPKPGLPFTLTSYYHTSPLFSDALRREFAARYSLLAGGIYFDVFTCEPRAPATNS